MLPDTMPDAIRVVTQPTVEPVLLAEAKLALKIDHDTEDSWLTTHLIAARQASESFTRRSYINQTREIIKAVHPSAPYIVLPYPPVQTITKVEQYTESTGVWTALTLGTGYAALILGDRASVTIKGLTQLGGLFKVVYTAGYGAAGSAVPALLRAAILRRLATMYEHREDSTPLALSSPVITATEEEAAYRVRGNSYL